MKNLVNNKLVFISLGLILFISGCYTIAYIIQPNSVYPDSAFNVTICIHPSDEGLRGDGSSAYGILGIQLPVGWTVLDTVEYFLSVQEPYEPMSGYLLYNDSVVSFLDTSFSQSPPGYYWWGAQSFEEVNLLTLDEGFIYINIMPDSVLGEFSLKYVLGDDGIYYKRKPEDLFGIRDSTELMPIQVVISDVVNLREDVEWTVYPNPSDGEIFVQQGDFNGDAILKIYDMNGKLLKSTLLRESLSRVDLSDISQGAYIISLEKKDQIKTKKLIIQ